jgi:hypothetical protein
MTAASRLLVALIVFAVMANVASAQRGIPVPRIVPAPHPPVHPFIPHGSGQGDNRGEFDSTVPWIAGGFLLTGVAVLLGVYVWRNRTVAHLRIVRLPPGEAPEEIRRAWIGTELPLKRRQLKPQVVRTVGVQTNSAGQPEAGYAVDGKLAVAALASHSPAAADWWREHAPHVVMRGYQLEFPEGVCEVVK